MPARPRELTPDRSARHLFGAKMRAYRERGAISLEGLSDVVKISRSHLSRIETAEAMPPPSLPAMLDAAFGTDGIFEELYRLASKEIHPDRYRRRMEFEARARVIDEFSGQLVTGLIQTEEYARALFQTYDPRRSPDEIEELWTVRLSRQAHLRADPQPDLSVILDEAVLRRSFGGPAVMRAQLARLIDVTLTPTTTLQVLPFAHGGHALAGGSLSLFTLEDGTQVAWDEGYASGTLLEDPETVRHRRRAYDRLRACALSPRDSAAFIRSVMEALPT
ncbi:helix-turn-helix domain-containing protein [Streptomyces noursei]|uniref:helix-turn-helix domain-containing protein n=1 Tax=Streptomyces noursei TaxID=1971 RepID=UPI001675E9A3|nr:helix-turn-helix transcriptional regulator [Streptomyces noursei]MCZ1016286.1 helix-turn-helix transcriptional regulator [Streptomyces noursei]GGX00810.1 transcriptional regulator [Streptomyces noursei]